jgi:hypothetical protein
MRLVIAGLILVLTPAAMLAKSPKGQCKDRCDGQYRFCRNRSTTKQAAESCKVTRKVCKSQCGR